MPGEGNKILKKWKMVFVLSIAAAERALLRAGRRFLQI